MGTAPTSSAFGFPLFVSLPSFYFNLSILSHSLFHMVKGIEERLAVDAHPRKKGLDFLILVEDETDVDDGLLQKEADGLVVGDAVAEGVNFVKLVEDVRVIVLHLWCGAGHRADILCISSSTSESASRLLALSFFTLLNIIGCPSWRSILFYRYQVKLLNAEMESFSNASA